MGIKFGKIGRGLNVLSGKCLMVMRLMALNPSGRSQGRHGRIVIIVVWIYNVSIVAIVMFTWIMPLTALMGHGDVFGSAEQVTCSSERSKRVQGECMKASPISLSTISFLESHCEQEVRCIVTYALCGIVGSIKIAGANDAIGEWWSGWDTYEEGKEASHSSSQ